MIKQGVLILGATSAIARSCAEQLAKEGYPLFFAGRDQGELERLSSDFRIRYSIDVKNGLFDAKQGEHHRLFLDQVLEEMGGLDGVISAVGFLGDQQRVANEFEEMKTILTTNFTGICAILSYCGDYFEQQRKGFIIGISSVAGDRGRQSNYVYGSAKAGFTTFLQGLRNRLYPSGVHVMTVKPGFVDTSMTFGLPVFLVASPKIVGKKIIDALHEQRDMVYVPWFWRYIMAIVKRVPEGIFKKLKF